MARRDQPYLPLYVQDFMSDERLSECSAESTGVYIRLMCLMHKSETYGAILLKQKDKQNESKIKDFAFKFVRQMPYPVDVIERSLTELIEENVIQLDGDMLYQKRMVKDGKLSDIRASTGKKGGMRKASESKNSDFACDFACDFAKAKTEANTEDEDENEITNEDEDITVEVGNTEETTPARGQAVISIILNDKSEFQIFQADVDEWQEIYPAVDIIGELRKMKGWCNANPDRRKTRRGIRRFINGWLSREQDRGGSARYTPHAPQRRTSASDTAMSALQQLHQKYSEEGSG